MAKYEVVNRWGVLSTFVGTYIPLWFLVEIVSAALGSKSGAGIGTVIFSLVVALLNVRVGEVKQ